MSASGFRKVLARVGWLAVLGSAGTASAKGAPIQPPKENAIHERVPNTAAPGLATASAIHELFKGKRLAIMLKLHKEGPMRTGNLMRALNAGVGTSAAGEKRIFPMGLNELKDLANQGMVIRRVYEDRSVQYELTQEANAIIDILDDFARTWIPESKAKAIVVKTGRTRQLQQLNRVLESK